MSDDSFRDRLPDRDMLKQIFGKSLFQGDRSPLDTRLLCSSITKLLKNIYGKDAEKLIDEAFAEGAIESGLSACDFLITEFEDRQQLLVRIGKIGRREIDLVTQARGPTEYMEAVRSIEMEVLEHASDDDKVFVYQHLQKVLWDLEIYGRIDIHLAPGGPK